ncbi:MAG TPA: phosphatidate cytidylyltransferase [Firmicutes bacterium]|nr:phosphatidate cytidylyltransferase [Bacillota bacterium]
MLRTRALTALAGIPVLLFFAYLGKYWYAFLILSISLLALKEFIALTRKKNTGLMGAIAYLFVPAALYAVYLRDLSLIIFFWMLLFAILNLVPVFMQGGVKYWESAVTFWGILYTVGLPGFLLAIRFLQDGFLLTLLLFFAIWAADICAYLFGRKIGKTPLAPKVSPKKTVEGFLAGLVASTIAGAALMFFFPLACLGWPGGALLGAFCGFAGALGDLGQSALKRSAGVKDSGSLLPGHGGILDRFDSLLFAAPFYYFFLFYLIQIPMR